MNKKRKFVGNSRVHCCVCGGFVGKDGFIDVFYDDFMGGYEEGYSRCAACLKKEKEEKERMEKRR